jgi:pimeloyl-ACP methyl ester carboxylesterase
MHPLAASRQSTFPLLAAAVAILGGVAIPRAHAEDSTETRLLGLARTVAAKVADPGFRRWAREQLSEPDDATRYGLQLDDAWQDAAAAAPSLPLAVLIHGFNSTPARNMAILAPLRAAGFPTAVFTYPNDADISESAALLSRDLKAFAAEHPGVPISLVTHSMGGLVARACVEDPALDPGNVARLVMIAPPTHGSMLAHASFGTDLWEHWLARREGNPWRRFRDSVVDGLGEAADELVPGSPFLSELNARPRNANIRYAIFLGTHAAISEREFANLRWVLRKSMKSEHLGRIVAPVDNVVEDLDEVVDGRGDGVVSIERGRLEGVDDVVLLAFDHFSCTGDVDDRDGNAVRQLQAELLARLR